MMYYQRAIIKTAVLSSAYLLRSTAGASHVGDDAEADSSLDDGSSILAEIYEQVGCTSDGDYQVPEEVMPPTFQKYLTRPRLDECLTRLMQRYRELGKTGELDLTLAIHGVKEKRRCIGGNAYRKIGPRVYEQLQTIEKDGFETLDSIKSNFGDGVYCDRRVRRTIWSDGRGYYPGNGKTELKGRFVTFVVVALLKEKAMKDAFGDSPTTEKGARWVLAEKRDVVPLYTAQVPEGEYIETCLDYWNNDEVIQMCGDDPKTKFCTGDFKVWYHRRLIAKNRLLRAVCGDPARSES